MSTFFSVASVQRKVTEVISIIGVNIAGLGSRQQDRFRALRNPLGQKIEAVEGIVAVRRSRVGRCAAIGMMRIASFPHFCSWLLLRITLAKTGAA
jgi:hypothetical protein